MKKFVSPPLADAPGEGGCSRILLLDMPRGKGGVEALRWLMQDVLPKQQGNEKPTSKDLGKQRGAGGKLHQYAGGKKKEADSWKPRKESRSEESALPGRVQRSFGAYGLMDAHLTVSIISSQFLSSCDN